MVDRGADLTNKLYYGDNLGILREFPDGFVDLAYLDPPFNSNADYNVIFKDEAGRKSDAQLLAFEDTWHWGPRAEAHYAYLTNTQLHRGNVPTAVSALIDALRSSIHENQLLAYLVEMAVRLVELRRLLKPSGSLYLHCDPTASHYLKLILDGVFGPTSFQNEIIWRRTAAHTTTRRWPRLHDVLLFYGKDPSTLVFKPLKAPADEGWVAREYRFADQRGRYMLDNLTGAGVTNGPSGQAWRGVEPAKIGSGRHWRYVPETLDRLDTEGRIHWPTKGKYPKLKQYLHESSGSTVGDLWLDIQMGRTAKERLGWDTQKPRALLERIIESATEPGDVVLDAFCGCGTAIDAAQNLGRHWIGVDITYLAIVVMRRRMEARYPELGEIEVVNRPTELAGARQMAESEPEGRYQFQWWALDEIGALPQGDSRKKGPDRGIDGTITFSDVGGVLRSVIVSVKSGKPHVNDVRVLRAVVEGEKAAMGILVTLEEPTPQARQDAAAAGLWHSDLYDRDYPRIQILTARQLIEAKKKPDLPPLIAAPYTAERRKVVAEQPGLSDLMDEVDGTGHATGCAELNDLRSLLSAQPVHTDHYA